MRTIGRKSAVLAACAALALLTACSRPAPAAQHRSFPTPDEAVQALRQAVARGAVDDVRTLFGAEGNELIDSSEPATARRNREVFTIAFAEGWRLVDEDGRKVLVIGNEAWPFPVPLVRDDAGWRFDAAAGREEVIARRIGRNELAAIRISRMYVAAQRLYAQRGHDGKRAGLYARTVRSDAGRQNGLYWAAAHGQPRSPIGDLIAQAAGDRAPSSPAPPPATPFYGYYFRILTAQGAAAPGGARDYLVNGELSGGFALVAWPAQYDITGIMTFVVNQDGVVHEKDLGPATAAAARAITLYDPDASWRVAE
jgi:hypothetical protein